MDLLDKDLEKSRKRRRTARIILVLILAIVILLRVFNIGHVLTWDEAWNAHTIIDGANGYTEDSFFPNFWRHPPAYTGLGILWTRSTSTGREGLATFMEIISLICSVLLALVIYICGRDWFDEMAGLAAVFLFAVMPSARVFDTWIKQESMVALFCLLFLLFFFRKRYLVAGVFLGIGLLTKETAIFFPISVLLFLLLSRRFKEIRGFTVSAVVGALISFWWFVFFSSSAGEYFDFFLGRSTQAKAWGMPWSYYLSAIPKNIGYLATFLSALAVLILVLSYVKSRALKEKKSLPPGYQMALFLLVLIVVVYVPISISYGKPPWMIYSALPAFALLGGWGFSRGFKLVSGRRYSSAIFAGSSLILALMLTLTFVLGDAGLGGFSALDRAYTDKKVTQYINQEIGTAGRVIMYASDASPTLMFYLDCYDPDSLLFIPPGTRSLGREYVNYSIYLLDKRTAGSEALELIESSGLDLMVLIDRPEPGTGNASDLDAELREQLEPARVDGAHIFKVGPLNVVPGDER